MDGMLVHDGAAMAHGGAPSATAWSALSFLAMWVVMTVAMMAPSTAPTLWRYGKALAGAGAIRAGVLTAVVGTAYLAVWTMVGTVTFVVGVAWVEARTFAPELTSATPVAAGAVLVIAGGIQFTRWKARRLARCRPAFAPLQDAQTDVGAAWHYGLRLGRACCLSCAGVMAGLLAVGAMDVRTMALATLAITAERLAPAGDHVARAIGFGAIAGGTVMIFRAAVW